MWDILTLILLYCFWQNGFYKTMTVKITVDILQTTMQCLVFIKCVNQSKPWTYIVGFSGNVFRRPLNWINLKSNSGLCLHQAGHCEHCVCAHCSTAHAPVPHPPGPYQSIRERKMVARGASGAKIDHRKTRLDLFIHSWGKRFVRGAALRFDSGARKRYEQVIQALASVENGALRLNERASLAAKTTRRQNRPGSTLRHLVPSLRAFQGTLN